MPSLRLPFRLCLLCLTIALLGSGFFASNQRAPSAGFAGETVSFVPVSWLYYQTSIQDPEALNSVNGLAIDPDGGHLYALSQFNHSVARYGRDSVSGSLQFLEAIQDGEGEVRGMRFPQGMQMSPDGRNLYIVGFDDQGPSLVSFRRDLLSGQLHFLQSLKGCCISTDLAISPEGRYLYVAGWAGGTPDYANTIDIYRRETRTGKLTWLARETLGQQQSAIVESILISPDGWHLYADGGLVFERNMHSGLLRWLPGMPGFSGTSPVLSANGENLYSADRLQHALEVFSRDPIDGSLNRIESHVDGVDGVRGLEGICSLTSSGGFLLAGGCSQDSLVLFRRASETGSLQSRQVLWNGSNGVIGMGNPVSLVSSPDNAFIYVAGRDDDSIVILGFAQPALQIFFPILGTGIP